MEYVESRLEEWNVDAQTSGMKQKTSFVADMAEMLGVGVRALHRWRSGKSKTISFVLADQILCKLDACESWYVSPLREHYERCTSNTCEKGHPLSAMAEEGVLTCATCRRDNRLKWAENARRRQEKKWKTTEQLISERIAA